ncbi:cadherin-related family member 1-like [Littorina saxatilis]|uniref:cadherin-related family member 1-like n=1 Tax=Littorina saxatilis TaxID=31220 RepID=UPI0038B53FAB
MVVFLTNTLTIFICLLLTIFSSCVSVLANRTPQPGSFVGFLIKSEDTPVETILGNISAFDDDGPDPLTFSIPDQLTSQLVELQNLRTTDSKTWVMDVVLIKKLDRDFDPPERKLTFHASDGKSKIALEVTLMIQDVNDEAPLLLNLPYKVTINENQAVDSVIFANISAFDPDNGRGSTVEYSLTVSFMLH